MIASRWFASMLCVLAASAPISASAVIVSGYLNDPANTALVASDGYQDLQAPRFGNDDEIARNVAVYQLNVTTAGNISFVSGGYFASGAEPYFSLFSGAGTAAAFVDSNGISDPFNIDFSLSYSLSVGTYMFTVGVWPNQSFAENNPDADPTLGDGFTALGNPSALGNYYYELDISSLDGAIFDIAPATDIVTPPRPVPEPATLALLLPLMLLLGMSIQRRRTGSAGLGFPR